MTDTLATPVAPPSEFDEYLDDLIAVRDWLIAHPGLPEAKRPFLDQVRLWVWRFDFDDDNEFREAVSGYVRRFIERAPIGSIQKEYEKGTIDLTRMFGKIKLTLTIGRDEVCEATVVGTETVEIPDPNAPKITVERDIVEWDCKPLLGIEGL